MIKKVIQSTFLLCFASLFLFSTSYAENTFERELVVKDQTRIMKVESVFKKLLQAYEDENAREFLDLVSDDRFRQDYITFTDALYSDFRELDIHQVDYWIDRVVSDHIKQFLYVKWEKRFERIDDGRQGTQEGFSRFLFDEVNGKYLLIELAGNTLFGGNLQEWRDETPPIPGEVSDETPIFTTSNVTGGTDIAATVKCSNASLGACDEFNCAQNGGYWYNNTCNSKPEGKPDLIISYAWYDTASVSGTMLKYTIANVGEADSKNCQLSITYQDGSKETIDIDAIKAGDSYSDTNDSTNINPRTADIDSTKVVNEKNESNNLWEFPY